jgi:hypothetical protein
VLHHRGLEGVQVVEQPGEKMRSRRVVLDPGGYPWMAADSVFLLRRNSRERGSYRSSS